VGDGAPDDEEDGGHHDRGHDEDRQRSGPDVGHADEVALVVPAADPPDQPHDGGEHCHHREHAAAPRPERAGHVTAGSSPSARPSRRLSRSSVLPVVNRART
jgi:hypothetical protein